MDENERNDKQTMALLQTKKNQNKYKEIIAKMTENELSNY